MYHRFVEELDFCLRQRLQFRCIWNKYFLNRVLSYSMDFWHRLSFVQLWKVKELTWPCSFYRFDFFSLRFELSNVILRKRFRASLYMEIFLSSGAITTKWKTRWGAQFYFTVSSIIQNNSLRSWKVLHQYTLK